MGKRQTNNQNQLAERYQVSSNTIRTWIKEGAPKRKNGYYNLAAWDAWVEKNKPDHSATETLAYWKLEREKEQALKLKREREIAEGRLVDGPTIRTQAETAASRVKTTLLRIPSSIGAILGVEAQRRAQDIVEEALKELRENPIG